MARPILFRSRRFTGSVPALLAWALIFPLIATPLIAADNPVASWQFDESSGSMVLDSSGNGADGLIVGATRGPGIAGGALAFDGTDFVGVPNATGYPQALAALPYGSISVWFKLDPLQPLTSTLRPVFYMGNGLASPNDNALVIELGHGYPGGSVLYFTFYDHGATPLCFDSTVPVTAGVWHQFVAVVGPDFNTGYLDGVELVDRHYNVGDPTSSEFLGSVVEHGNLWLGKGYAKQLADPRFFEGMIDAVEIFDRPLTEQEVASDYAAFMSPVVDPFVRGDANGDTVVDIADSIRILDLLFANVSGSIDCLNAADTNDDGAIDIADPIYGLGALFSAGPIPAAPYPDCGADPTPGALPCVSPVGCL